MISQNLQKMAEGERFNNDYYSQVFEIHCRWSFKCKLNASDPYDKHLESLKSYENMLLLQFKRAIDFVTDRNIDKYRDTNLRIQTQNINAFLKDLYAQLASILYNHHLILRFHNSALICFDLNENTNISEALNTEHYQSKLRKELTDSLLQI